MGDLGVQGKGIDLLMVAAAACPLERGNSLFGEEDLFGGTVRAFVDVVNASVVDLG